MQIVLARTIKIWRLLYALDITTTAMFIVFRFHFHLTRLSVALAFVLQMSESIRIFLLMPTLSFSFAAEAVFFFYFPVFSMLYLKWMTDNTRKCVAS